MNTEQDNSIDNKPLIQPGTLLKQKRESLGLSQKQIADRLRLRVAIIRNIEENQFDSDLVSTFIRGYLRSYARAVGVNEHDIMDAYEANCATEPQEQKMQSFSRKTKRAKHDNRIMTITWIIVLVIIGMSSLWWWQNNQQDSLLPANNLPINSNEIDTAPPVVEASSEFATVSELTQAQEQEASTSDIEAIEPVEPIASIEDDAEAQVIADQTITAVETVPNNLLTMHFSADCWIQVKDATGKTLSTGIKKAGQTVNLQGETPLQVILGAPEGVSVTFASEPIDLSGYTSGKVARFTLP
ncbi:RodZ domain-containing protein [Vibrio fujianensis]|uniref:RodZ domain-containing protein n=1 Tax=Vibrio fujianensis TaxID=1974215 RepID=UPI000C170E47|nr:RodZ domain-containing protein [Vibrio fujianensis]